MINSFHLKVVVDNKSHTTQNKTFNVDKIIQVTFELSYSLYGLKMTVIGSSRS